MAKYLDLTGLAKYDSKIKGYIDEKAVTVDTVLSDSSENPISNKAVKAAIDNLEIGGGVIIDTALSTTSENPVQNKVISAKVNQLYTVISNKADPITVDTVLSDSSENPISNKAVKAAFDNLEIPNSITVDKTLSTTSENPVQNKVVKNAIVQLNSQINTKQNKLTIDTVLSDVSENPVQNKVIFSKVKELEDSVSSIDTSAISAKQDILTAGNNVTISTRLSDPADPTSEEKLFIDVDIPEQITVDSALSDSSENPVQNKVVKAALDAKQDALTIDSELSATSENPVQNKAIKAALDGKQVSLVPGANVEIVPDASGTFATISATGSGGGSGGDYTGTYPVSVNNETRKISVDLSSYALADDVPENIVTEDALNNYALKTEIPDVNGFISDIKFRKLDGTFVSLAKQDGVPYIWLSSTVNLENGRLEAYGLGRKYVAGSNITIANEDSSSPTISANVPVKGITANGETITPVSGIYDIKTKYNAGNYISINDSTRTISANLPFKAICLNGSIVPVTESGTATITAVKEITINGGTAGVTTENGITNLTISSNFFGASPVYIEDGEIGLNYSNKFIINSDNELDLTTALNSELTALWA